LYNNEVEYNGYWENGEQVDHKPDMKNVNKKQDDRYNTQTTMIDVNKTLGSNSK
jgi:hypothetical protein